MEPGVSRFVYYIHTSIFIGTTLLLKKFLHNQHMTTIVNQFPYIYIYIYIYIYKEQAYLDGNILRLHIQKALVLLREACDDRNLLNAQMDRISA